MGFSRGIIKVWAHSKVVLRSIRIAEARVRFPVSPKNLGELRREFDLPRNNTKFCYRGSRQVHHHAHVAQVVEHILGKNEVRSANLRVGSRAR